MGAFNLVYAHSDSCFVGDLMVVIEQTEIKSKPNIFDYFLFALILSMLVFVLSYAWFSATTTADYECCFHGEQPKQLFNEYIAETICDNNCHKVFNETGLLIWEHKTEVWACVCLGGFNVW